MMSELLFVDFNQDNSCLGCGTSQGFSVWNTKPLEKRIERKLNASIHIVQPLFKTNVIALVGEHRDSSSSPNQWSMKNLNIWDDAQEKIVTTMTYESPIVSVRITRNMLLVATKRRVYVYHRPFDKKATEDKKNTATVNCNQFVTYDNTYSTIALSSNSEPAIAVFPGINQGYVHVSDKGDVPSRIVNAHENEIAALAISSDGKQLATMSTKGTVLRVWDMDHGDLLFEFRRGTTVATITCIQFSADNRWLVVGSGRGTVHVFDIREKPVKSQLSSTTTNYATYLSNMLPVWSFAQCRFPATEANVRVGMDKDYNVFVATEQGDYYWFRINPIHGGLGCMKLHSRLE